ncbi:MAG: hypothetical protein ABJO01_09115 [Parasphingorhabdus sp.]|uniref:hypothetical protein n=1 Tax=Parasphingorhabdus sp. TaxID=2709688 RepID=UPI0032972FEC
MNVSKDAETDSNQNEGQDLEQVILSLANHIAKQNKLRSTYFSGISFGDPIWDILLDIYGSETLDRATTITAISDRQNQPPAISKRCISYLLETGAIFENRNRYTLQKFQFLATDKTKQEVTAWLKNCIATTPQF